jgi:RimJ/RimL family protein N-acetyltransferase
MRTEDFKLIKLKHDRIDDLVDLENCSMKTDTTFPLTKDELTRLYEEGYVSYGFENEDSVLISKVGFSKIEDKNYELDVCVHPDYRGGGMGHEIIKQSIDKFLSENPGSDIFLTVHPDNPALRLYERLGFEAIKDDEDYKINQTKNGPRITMDYKKTNK